MAWIYGELLGGRPAKVLDLGCGPGLYSSRLARLGHTCVGVDYALRAAQEEGLSCTYVQEDIRRADYGVGYRLAMLIFGEFNVFTNCLRRAVFYTRRLGAGDPAAAMESRSTPF